MGERSVPHSSLGFLCLPRCVQREADNYKL